MRKTIFLLISALLMMSMGIVTQAQQIQSEQGSILDIANGTDNLSTLVAAVEAADPSIAETLDDAGTYTVLAPTNQAFENLMITLGITTDDLLTSPLLTDILRYHVIDGKYFTDNIETLDGSQAGTFLTDNFVAVSVAEDGTIMLNDVASVIASDIEASNGVIQMIDEVLLPRTALENFALVDPQNVNVQVMHFSPDAPNVDIYVNGEVAYSNLAFGTTSGYMTIPANDQEIAVAPAGTSIDDAVFGPTIFNFTAGEFVNFAAVGTLEDDILTITTFNQGFPALADDEISVTLLHAIEDAPNVDVMVNGEAAVEDLAFPFSQVSNDGAFNLTATLPIDTLTVNVSGENTQLLDLSGTTFEAGTYYIVVVGGTADAPVPYVFVTASARAAELDDALYNNMGMDDNMDMNDMDSDNTDMDTSDTMSPSTVDMTFTDGTIAEIVINSANSADPEFSILLQAIQNADPAVLETLQSAGPLTVFAPTDRAFANLLSTADMTIEELLASEYLTDILLYHVANGQLMSSDIADDSAVQTLLPERNVGIGVAINDDGTVVLNNIARVIQADVQATNGAIHVINQVILPRYIAEAFGL